MSQVKFVHPHEILHFYLFISDIISVMSLISVPLKPFKWVTPVERDRTSISVKFILTLQVHSGPPTPPPHIAQLPFTGCCLALSSASQHLSGGFSAAFCVSLSNTHFLTIPLLFIHTLSVHLSAILPAPLLANSLSCIIHLSKKNKLNSLRPHDMI